MKLGVNIDHVATLRQARGEDEPDVVQAARIALDGGADGITVHLREDRRHIQDKDVIALAKFVPRLNLEMATSEEILQIACELKPQFCCLVPEKRAELTTEGGLDVANNLAKIKTFTHKLNLAGILVSLFIEADSAQILKAKEAGAQYIEIHTGKYANTQDAAQQQELAKIKAAVEYAEQLGLKVNAGHGLKYYNTAPIAAIKTIEELNIGHSIISRAVFVGLKSAVEEMKRIML